MFGTNLTSAPVMNAHMFFPPDGRFDSLTMSRCLLVSPRVSSCPHDVHPAVNYSSDSVYSRFKCTEGQHALYFLIVLA